MTRQEMIEALARLSHDVQQLRADLDRMAEDLKRAVVAAQRPRGR